MTEIKKGVILIFTVSICIFILGGCGEEKMNRKSPEAVIKSLIRSYQEQNIQAVKECYGIDAEEEPKEDVQKEINYNMRLFKAYQAKSVHFEKADCLGKSGDSQLAYLWFSYEPEDEEINQKYPVLAFYFVEKKDKAYCVVPAKNVTEEMSEYSRSAYKKFMDTNTYKDYEKNLETFQKNFPSYEEEMDKNFRQSGSPV